MLSPLWLCFCPRCEPSLIRARCGFGAGLNLCSGSNLKCSRSNLCNRSSLCQRVEPLSMGPDISYIQKLKSTIHTYSFKILVGFTNFKTQLRNQIFLFKQPYVQPFLALGNGSNLCSGSKYFQIVRTCKYFPQSDCYSRQGGGGTILF